MSNKTIAMFLDGTWNTPESNTNVYRAKMLVASSNGSSEQRVYYDPGLGTQSFESFRGGVRRGQLVERVEQRWFCGSHGDVGGGDNLNVVSAPFAWIMQKAETRGLKLTETPMVSGHEHVLNDSYKAFIKGLYRIVRFGKRYRRKIGSAGNQVTGGWIEPIRETIDESVFRRWQAVPKYRPQNLIKALEQRSCAPEQQTEDLIL